MRIRFGNFVLDTSTRQLGRNSQPVQLSPKAFQLLQALLENRPRALSKKELIDVLWPNVFVEEENLKARIAEIRRALGDRGERRYIRTIQRFGYAFEAAAWEDGVRPMASSGGLSAWLVESEGDHFNLVEGENLVGREVDAHVRIDVSSVSRRHARITIAGGQAMLEDLGSKNGTLVGAERLHQPTILKDGDRIQFGSVLVRIRNSASLPSTESVGADES